MSRAVQEWCISSCVRCYRLPDPTHKSYLLRSTAISVSVNHVHSRFRHLHVVHGLSSPLAKLSSKMTVVLCGIACSLLSHAYKSCTGNHASLVTIFDMLTEVKQLTGT